MAQLLPALVRQITKEVSKGARLSAVLSNYDVSPMEFFNYLEENPEDLAMFEKARRVAMEVVVDDLMEAYDNVTDRFELERQKAIVAHRTWMAEKLIPKTYGTRIEHNVNQTINIRAILEQADKRAGFVETTSRPVPALPDANDDLTDEEKSLI